MSEASRQGRCRTPWYLHRRNCEMPHTDVGRPLRCVFSRRAICFRMLKFYSMGKWGRARALQAAYERQRLEAADDSDRYDVPLTTGDIFHWLEDEGLCLRKSKTAPSLKASSSTTVLPRARKAMVKTDETLAEVYCRFCGLHRQYHTTSLLDTNHSDASNSQTNIRLEPSTTLSKPIL